MTESDREHAWVLTTTLPDGTFDFFRFAALLQSASLLELQMELLYASLCADEYEQLASLTFGEEGETMKQKAKLYSSLWAMIDNELFDRLNPTFAPGCPN